MYAAASLFAVYLAFSISYWARHTQMRAPLRALALAMLIGAVLAWQAIEQGPASILVPLSALMTAGSAIVILTPLYPRLMLWIAIGCAPLWILMLAGGVCGS